MSKIYIYNIHKVLRLYYLRISSKYFHILKNLFFHVLILTMPHFSWFSVQSQRYSELMHMLVCCVHVARTHTHKYTQTYTIKQTPNPNPRVSHYLKDDCDFNDSDDGCFFFTDFHILREWSCFWKQIFSLKDRLYGFTSFTS